METFGVIKDPNYVTCVNSNSSSNVLVVRVRYSEYGKDMLGNRTQYLAEPKTRTNGPNNYGGISYIKSLAGREYGTNNAEIFLTKEVGYI